MTRTQWIAPLTMAMAMAMMAASPALAAEPVSDEPIPAVLVDPEQPAQTPAPTCTICALVAKKTASDGSHATVTLTNEADFEGDVELVVWLDSEQRASIWIPDITIVAGEAVEVEVEVEAIDGWDWDDAQFAWVRFYSTH